MAEQALISEEDAYYFRQSERFVLPIYRMVLKDDESKRYYIDPRSGALLRFHPAEQDSRRAPHPPDQPPPQTRLALCALPAVLGIGARQRDDPFVRRERRASAKLLSCKTCWSKRTRQRGRIDAAAVVALAEHAGVGRA
jgi:hypothetical protein